MTLQEFYAFSDVALWLESDLSTVTAWPSTPPGLFQPDGTAFNGSLWVVCKVGHIFTTRDFQTWTDCGAPISNPTFAVWTGHRFIVVSYGSGRALGRQIATSEDGITWTTRATPTDNVVVNPGTLLEQIPFFDTIAGSGDTWVVAGQSIQDNNETDFSHPEHWLSDSYYPNYPVCAVSTDGGLTWGPLNIPIIGDYGIINGTPTTPDAPIKAHVPPAFVTHGPSGFVATSRWLGGDVLLHSPDGVDWNIVGTPWASDYSFPTYGHNIHLPIGTIVRFDVVGALGDKFVLRGASSSDWMLSTSTDGINWTSPTIPPGAFLNFTTTNNVLFGMTEIPFTGLWYTTDISNGFTLFDTGHLALEPSFSPGVTYGWIGANLVELSGSHGANNAVLPHVRIAPGGSSHAGSVIPFA